jgi:Leucine-rich repeat (LRR) protein
VPWELASLTALQQLDLKNTRIGDLAPLAGLTALRSLSLRGTQVNDLAALAHLTSLQVLDLSDTRVEDLGPLAGLAALQRLDLWTTKVRDLAPLAKLAALQTLNLASTPVEDITPLASLTTLQDLWLSGTRVTDITPLANLTELRSLWIVGTQVSDLTPLANMKRMQDIADLNTIPALSYGQTPASRTAPFNLLATLEDPVRTVDTINAVRKRQGLLEHIPQGYKRPAEVEKTLRRVEPSNSQIPPRIPGPAPAALEPIFSNGRISLPFDAVAADLGEDTRDAALSALKTDLGELAADVEGEANVDRRAARLLRNVGALVPQTGPPQDVLFRLAHKEEVLVAYAPTVNKEWPEILASRYHVVCRQFDRTMRQFPKWREFKRNAAKDRFTPEQLAEVPPIARQAIDSLADEGTEPFVDPEVPQSLEELAAPLRPQQHGDAGNIIEASKELLVEDVVESINNILKRVAEVALAAGLTAKEAAEHYAKGLAKGLIDAAKKQGSKDGAALLKWARRFLVAGGGATAAGAFIQRLIQTFPEKFAWLEAVIKFFGQ